MKKKFFALSMAVLLVLVSVIGCSTDSADGSYVTFNLGTEPIHQRVQTTIQTLYLQTY